MIGSKINGFKILRFLGTGGMADVYYAENNLGMPAAVKILRSEMKNNAQIKDRFIQEAKIIKQLQHPNIRKVMDIGELDGKPVIIMEYLSGMTLSQKIQAGKIPDIKLQKYFDQCVQALAHTHRKNIIHRDIKPSNIFITDEDEVKIMDYGIAKIEEGFGRTRTGQTLGTILYMSPEQITDPKRVNSKTDIYSLGVTFYHALSAKPPYDMDTGSEYVIMKKIVDEDLRLELIPVHWRATMKACLSKKPHLRKLAPISKSNDSTIIDHDASSRDRSASSTSKNRSQTSYRIPAGFYLLILILVVSIIYVANQPSYEYDYENDDTEISNSQKVAAEIAANMVRIPGGTFTMGCTSGQGDDCYDDEKPHQVTLSAFRMSKYEVTQEQWQAIMGNNPSEFKNCPKCPVEFVSWNDVQEFIKKLNNMTGETYRLPTEAEWEYAARGGQDYKYAGSDNIETIAWYVGNSSSKTHPVGSKAANGYGLYDMSGNVMEWCSDWYGDYSSGSITNPQGPSSGSFRVIRGGSWCVSAEYCRVADRPGYPPSSRSTGIGFRVVLSQ